MGYLVLQGGEEFKGRMRESDLRALSLCGGLHAPVAIIPAAAAADGNAQRAGKNGERWFRSLGASRVTVVPLIDRGSADDPKIASVLQTSRLIYLLGGFPGYLAQSLVGSASREAMQTAFDNDAVLAGSSAGAMVLCDRFYDPAARRMVEGLGWVAHCCVLPHHNTFGRQWAPWLKQELPKATLIGIDEATGAVSDTYQNRWTVYGYGNVTLYKEGDQYIFSDGMTFAL